MTSPVDPNAVMMTGENSFIRLSHDGGRNLSERLSHWRVLWSPAGPGHALFAEGSLTRGRVRVYSDSPSVARWLQREVETWLHPPFASTDIPVIPAVFERAGDPRATATEIVDADDEFWRLEWFDCIEPFVLHMPPGAGDRPIGVFTTFFPARLAQVSLNGRFGEGEPWAEQRGDRDASSATLAWSETWVRPRA